MSSMFGTSSLVIGMFVSGCANSLLSKYQDKQCVDNCGPDATGPRVDFEQPVYQTLNMFAGELGCVIPLLWAYYRSAPVKAAALPPQASAVTRILARLPLGTASSTAPEGYARVSGEEADGEPDERPVKLELDDTLSGYRMCLMWFPAFCDICGTTLMNTGLILTPVSIYQMSRGALVLWVGVLSVIFLRRKLWLYQWMSLIIVTLGVSLVGLSGSMVKKTLEDVPDEGLVARVMEITRRSDDDPAKVALGVILVLFAQIFTASQYVIEEKIMARYKVEPMAAVALEGFFGLMTTLIAMPFLHIFFHTRSAYFDIPRGWHQITHNTAIGWTCLAIAFSIGFFNFFGLSVTNRVSATTRSTIDTCRTLGIWIVSLSIGWEQLVFPVSLLQVAGFAMLVYGTFVFNGLIATPCFTPPANIRLPHEPGLEQTGELPAAAEQGRVGYDVVPHQQSRNSDQ